MTLTSAGRWHRLSVRIGAIAAVPVVLGVMLASGVMTDQPPDIHFPAGHPHGIWFDVAGEVTAFGGYYWDEDRNLHVHFAESMDLREASEKVARAFNVDPDKIVPIEAQYSMAQIGDWLYGTDFEARMFRVDGVNAVGISARNNRLLVTVESQEAHDRAREAIAETAIPQEAVIVRVTGSLQPDRHGPIPSVDSTSD